MYIKVANPERKEGYVPRLNVIKGVYLKDTLATVRVKAYLQVVNTTDEKQRVYIPTIKVYKFETNKNQILDSSSNSNLNSNTKSDYLSRSILNTNSIANSNYLGNSISNSNLNLNSNINSNYLGSSSSNLNPKTNPNSCCLGSTIPNSNFNFNLSLYKSHDSTSNSNLKSNSILIPNSEDSNLNSKSCFVIKYKKKGKKE